jgi:hypothetical protein
MLERLDELRLSRDQCTPIDANGKQHTNCEVGIEALRHIGDVGGAREGHFGYLSSVS